MEFGGGDSDKFAVNLEDEIDLAGLDFSDFDDDGSLLTESVLDRIDTREIREDSFDFEVDGDGDINEVEDEFADILEGHESSMSDAQDAVITPPVAPSVLETKERFPRIRPLIDAEVKSAQDPDRTEEVTALIDDFTSESGLDTHDSTITLGQADVSSNSGAKQETTDDDEFGGLLEPDE